MIARMTGEAAHALHCTYEQYLAFECATRERYEWLDGVVYTLAGERIAYDTVTRAIEAAHHATASTGGTLVHGALSAAIVSELRNLALACGCAVFSSDAKVRIEETGLSTYPDASVVCGPLKTASDDGNAMTNPTLLVEVLSESTEASDRGRKWWHYRRISSLRHFVLVSQYERRIEVYSREGDTWVLREAEAGGSVELAALGGALNVDRLYAGVTLSDATPAR